MLFCCPACPLPKTPPVVLLPCAWPKLQPDPPAVIFDPPPKRLLPPPPPPPPPKSVLPPAVLVLANGFAAEDAGGLAVDPKSPLPGVEAVALVWPKILPELPLVTGLPKGKALLDFAGSDIVFVIGAVARGLGSLSAVDLPRGFFGRCKDILRCRRLNLPRRRKRAVKSAPQFIVNFKC